MNGDVTLFLEGLAITTAVFVGHRLYWNNKYGHLVEGSNFYNAGKYAEALKAFDRAAVKHPDDWRAPLSAAGACLKLHDPVRALKYCAKAQKLLPNKASPADTASIKAIKASAECLNGDVKAAIDTTSQAIVLSPAHGSYYVTRAYMLSIAKDLERASADLDTAEKLLSSRTAQLNPGNIIAKAYVISNRARIAMLRNELDNALALAEKAVTLYEYPEILCTRAAAFIYLDSYDKAAADLELALERNAGCAEAYWFKAKLLERQGNLEEAAALERKALDWHYLAYF